MTVCVLLAAGSSSRMGKPKMLLPLNGKTLLQHMVDEIKKLEDAALLVVTGCDHLLINDVLEKQHVPLVENIHWQQGMGSSVQTGINQVMQFYPGADNVILMVCDQPFISGAILKALVATAQQTGKGIVAAAYNNTTGTPVLFQKKYFTILSQLSGEYGAKKLLQQFAGDVATVDFPGGSVDIDTMEDYEKLAV